MRLIARAALVSASIPIAVLMPGLASAVDGTEVTFAFSVDGSTLNNTITNNSSSPILCTTSLGLAPGGVLPSVEDTMGPGQTLYESGDVQPGTTVQSVADLPDGSYVALATCSREGSDPAMWVSAYPGVEQYLTLFPVPAFTVQQASTVVTIPGDATSPFAGLGEIFGS